MIGNFHARLISHLDVISITYGSIEEVGGEVEHLQWEEAPDAEPEKSESHTNGMSLVRLRS
jgi:hypothetical protein